MKFSPPTPPRSTENFCFQLGDYSFGFQAQEQDEEMWGGSVTYKYRVEDPRLGRFFSVDPLYKQFPWNSNYAFSENRLIDGVELEGTEVRSYLFTQLFGGVGGIQIDVSTGAGLILAGARFSGSGGLYYDAKGNFAFSVSYGGFADFFNSFGTGFSTGGSPPENGSFQLGWTFAQVQASEVYYWAFDNVMDIKGASTVTSIGVSVWDLWGVSGSAITVGTETVGLSFGPTVGIPGGSPVEASNCTTYTSIVAFNQQDVINTYNAYEGITDTMEKKGIVDYTLSIQNRKLADGYTEVYWQAEYKDSAGKIVKEELSTTVKYKDIGDGSAATEKVISTNE